MGHNRQLLTRRVDAEEDVFASPAASGTLSTYRLAPIIHAMPQDRAARSQLPLPPQGVNPEAHACRWMPHGMHADRRLGIRVRGLR